MKFVSTIYDDVFRTLLNDCSHLILPVLNEMFGENYSGDEKIIFTPNEHFLNQQDGSENKIISDTSFEIIGKTTKKYHLECQSSSDPSMLVRIFEYGTQIALDEGKIVGNILKVTFPNSAILFLRHFKSTPDKMTIQIVVPNGQICYDVPIMKVQNYSVEEIFDKKLLFLLPFHIFVYEKDFAKYEANEDELAELQNKFVSIRQRLEKLQKSGDLDVYTNKIVCEMTKKTIEGLARKYDKVKEGVGKIMVGQILDYEAKRIFNAGREEQVVENLRSIIFNLKVTAEKAMEILNIPQGKREYYNKFFSN